MTHVRLAEGWAPFAFGISPVNGGNLFVYRVLFGDRQHFFAEVDACHVESRFG